jgi:hypothetical protein
MKSVLPFAILLFTFQARSIPPASEYTMVMLEEDLRDARMVALVQCVSIDTSSQAHTELTVLRVLATYKGGLGPGAELVTAKRRLGQVGWYEPDYRVGEQSFICLHDPWQDGVVAGVNTRGKFDVRRDAIDTLDYVDPPPVGLGFSAEFAGYTEADAFEFLMQQFIRDHEYLSVAPLLPRVGSPLTVSTSINLSGGATLDEVLLEASAPNSLHLYLTYTPCTGVCPYLYLVTDTGASTDSLPIGTYTAYRYKQNSMLDAPTPPDDSVTFQVYACLSVTSRRTSGAVFATSRRDAALFDITGRTLRRPSASGVVVERAVGATRLHRWSPRSIFMH